MALAAHYEGGGPASLVEIFAATAVPALAMACGSAAVTFRGEPSEQLQARLQHLSGGLLIGAVITDIFPILRSRLVVPTSGAKTRVDWVNFAAGVVGFVAALLLMYGVKSLGLEELEEEADGAEAAESAAPWWSRLFEALGLGGAARGGAREPLLVADAAPVKAPSPRPQLSSPAALTGGSTEEHGSGLRLAVAKLTARAAALGQLARAEDIDREAVDEEVHGLDFLIDMVRRRCHADAAEPLPADCAARLRTHVTDLSDEVRRARGLDPCDLPALDLQLQVIAGALRRIHRQAEQRGAAFRRWGTRPPAALAEAPVAASPSAPALPVAVAGDPTAPPSTGAISAAGSASASPSAAAAGAMPWGLVLAVLIDSIVDGMLIGLAGSVALASGWLMAMATAIEMGFLGYSFACAASAPAAGRGGPLLRTLVLGLPPAAMLAASLAASAGASDVEGLPVFVGLIAFALAAVLFMVVEELLLEAHEKEGSEEWHISVWLYVGLLLSICLDVLAG